MIPFKFHLKYLLVSNSWFIEGFIKDLFRNERRKENAVQCTDWDSNRECRKFDKVGKHSSSIKIITVNNYQCIISGKYTASNSH